MPGWLAGSPLAAQLAITPSPGGGGARSPRKAPATSPRWSSSRKHSVTSGAGVFEVGDWVLEVGVRVLSTLLGSLDGSGAVDGPTRDTSHESSVWT